MLKILFLIPPSISYEKFTNPGFNERVTLKKSGKFGSPVTDMPLGVISLSAYLKKHLPVESRLIDFNLEISKTEDFCFTSFIDFFEDFLAPEKFQGFKPDIIAISALFSTAYFNMLDLGRVAKKSFPGACLIAGGGIPTCLYREIFQETTVFDALCYGEGEKPFLRLAASLNKLEMLESDDSWVTQNKVRQKCQFQYDFIEDLDEIPFYDYDILDLPGYGVSPTLTNYSSFEVVSKPFHYSTSRGCPYHCCFCASHIVHGRKMRYHSIQRVKEDFIQLKEKFGAKIISFQDDNLTADKERVSKITNIANDLCLKLYFQNGITIHSLDREMLELMKSAGVTELVLPIESGCERVLKDIVHKPLNLSIVKRVVADCRDLNIDTYANILIGFPGETKEDIEESRKFLKSLDITWFRVVVATPLVGSKMLEICQKKNYLSKSFIGCDFKNAVVNTDDFTAEYIEKKAYLLNLELNFVKNSDLRLGNFRKALAGFENVMNVSQGHAFAYYFAAKCCQELDIKDMFKQYWDKYLEIQGNSEFWREKTQEFNLVPLR